MKPYALLVLAAGLMASTIASAQDPIKEAKKLEGTWDVVAVERAGEKLSEERIKALNFQVVLTGSKLVVRAGGQTSEATFQIDPTKQPATFDTTNKNNKVEKGIYLLEGDTLKICTAKAGGERPTKFATEAKTDHMLFVLRRAKP